MKQETQLRVTAVTRTPSVPMERYKALAAGFASGAGQLPLALLENFLKLSSLLFKDVLLSWPRSLLGGDLFLC
ncbi:MAG: hypothetical protein ACE5JU_11530 [Candidatus Binatia bacterium]